MLSHKYAIIADFDRCLADTFSPSPNGIGVDEAYEYAIECLFGKYGLKLYKELGGLKNRAPGEVIKEMLLVGKKAKMIKLAGTFFQQNKESLENLVPRGGFPLEWVNGLWDPTNVITELLIRCKLKLLMGEIGEEWPLPCQGAIEFLKVIDRIGSQPGIDIELIIISSGHYKFIRETLLYWNTFAFQGILVTDDVMRARKYPEKLSDRVKPSVTLFDLAHLMWFNTTHPIVVDQLQLVKFLRETHPRMMYFGDDPVKDGKLARVAGVHFGWFNPKNKPNSSLEEGKFFSFDDWRDVSQVFSQENTIQLFKAGRPFEEIIAPLL